MNKYVGIPYIAHGRSFEGCDCYGLVKLFYKEELGRELPEIDQYADGGDSITIQNLIHSNTPLLDGVKKDTLEKGDIVLMRFKGYTSHLGVCIGDNLVLHVLHGMNSVIMPIKHPFLRGRIEGFYGIGY